jgi:prepilin-type N-terminal cleavage/methylation domain-containing protein
MIRKIRSKKGFTLMELVVSTAIIGTLAAFAVPSYIKAGNKSKGAKSLDNINNIGAGILQAYSRVASNGDGTQAIATFVNHTSVTSGLNVIQYDSLGTVKYITYDDIFPGGVPVSPFTRANYVVSVSETGEASWTINGDQVVLTVTKVPQLTISDPEFSNIQNTFSP